MLYISCNTFYLLHDLDVKFEVMSISDIQVTKKR